MHPRMRPLHCLHVHMRKHTCRSSPAVLLAPFFLEGGRFTAYDTHYVAAADGSGQLTPAGQTEFARDRK